MTSVDPGRPKMWAEFGQVLYTLLVRMGMGIEYGGSSLLERQLRAYWAAVRSPVPLKDTVSPDVGFYFRVYAIKQYFPEDYLWDFY